MTIFLITGIVAICGIFATDRASASLPVFPGCGDAPIPGSFTLSPAQGPVGASFKLTGTVPPNKTYYIVWIKGDIFHSVHLETMNSDSLGDLAGSYTVPAGLSYYSHDAVLPGSYEVMIYTENDQPQGLDYFLSSCLTFEVTGSQVATDAYGISSAGAGIESGTLPETGLSLYEAGMLVLISGAFLFGRKYLGGG